MASMARGAKRRHSIISRKMLILFSASLSCVVVLVICSLFRFHSPKPPISISISRVVFDGPPKIAFLFLVRRNLPLDFLWDAFFQNVDVSRFSIYVHSAPGFVLDESTTRSQFLYGRQISNSIQVLWGESSMIQAERLLLAAALEDPANQRFVLLSDRLVFSSLVVLIQVSIRSCSFYVSVSLLSSSFLFEGRDGWDLAFVCANLLAHGKNLSFCFPCAAVFLCTTFPTCTIISWFLQGVSWTGRRRLWFLSFLDAKEGRYNPKMSTKIPREKWRKGSQWITVVRKHAEVVVDDDVIFSVFKKYCKRRPPIDTSKGKLNLKLQKQHNCIPDEHYVQTLLAMHDLEGELERRTLTYTLWNQSTTKMENKGWHPITFGYSNASPQRIKEIKGINHVYYETEYRIEWCHTNSTSVPCFLFARKFSQGAAMRLLSQEVVNHFEVSALHILQTANGITTSFNRHTPPKDFDGIIIQHTPHKQILKTKIGQVSADRML